jgi:hypothetical protein
MKLRAAGRAKFSVRDDAEPDLPSHGIPKILLSAQFLERKEKRESPPRKWLECLLPHAGLKNAGLKSGGGDRSDPLLLGP